MSRGKKQRTLGSLMTVLERAPRKQERLADPTSKESRRKKSQELRKKPKAVHARVRATQSATERDTNAGRKGTRHGGPLANKIRQLNAVQRERARNAGE